MDSYETTKYGFTISSTSSANFKPFVGMKVDFHQNKRDHPGIIEKVTI